MANAGCSSIARRAACSALLAGLGACAGLPKDLELQRTAIVADPASPKFTVNLTSSAGKGAGAGALTGAGTGALAGSAACLATGPWFPLCLMFVVSTGTGVGAVAGAVVGASMTETAEERQAKQILLSRELTSAPSNAMLVAHLQREASERSLTLAPPVRMEAVSTTAAGTGTSEGTPAPAWLVEIALLEIATEGKERFKFEVEARMRVRRPGSPQVLYERTFREDSAGTLTMNEWTANNAEAVGRELDVALRRLARRIIRELNRDAQAEYDAVRAKPVDSRR